MENGNYWSETHDREGSPGDGKGPRLDDPREIGRYRILRRLGQGGFGRVYLARDADLDRAVAIKVPNPERVAGRGDVEAYLAEARTLARLDHPNIVPVYDVGRTDDGLCYVVSKFIDGCDLAERLRQGRPSFRESAEIESTDPDTTFRVGLIYGPSGCGKSSLVKAGLLPRLGKDVLPVYLEATPEETEARLLRGIRKLCPDLPAGGTTVDALAAVRRGHILRHGQKLLLVLDQLEQWLFARRDEPDAELASGRLDRLARDSDVGLARAVSSWRETSAYSPRLATRESD